MKFTLKNQTEISEIDVTGQEIVLTGKTAEAVKQLSGELVYYRTVYGMNHVEVNSDTFSVRCKDAKTYITGDLNVALIILKAMDLIPKQLHCEIEVIINQKKSDFFTNVPKKQGSSQDIQRPKSFHSDQSNGSSVHSIPLMSK